MLKNTLPQSLSPMRLMDGSDMFSLRQQKRYDFYMLKSIVSYSVIRSLKKRLIISCSWKNLINLEKEKLNSCSILKKPTPIHLDFVIFTIAKLLELKG